MSNSKPKLKVLDAGAGSKPRQDEFPDAIYVTVDIDPATNPDLVHDITQPFPEDMLGTFDLVLAVHVLQHIPRSQVVETVKNLRDLLVDKGELHIYVPSMDWVGEELYVKPRVLGQRPNPYIYDHIYGIEEEGDNRHNVRRSGYTTMDFRDIFTKVGLVQRHFGQGHYNMAVLENGQEVKGRQIIAVGLRYLEYEEKYDQTDPANALVFD